MARRLFNGRRFSENGWPYVDEGSCTWITVPGTNPPVSLQIQNGPPLSLLRAWAADWNAYIEPLRDADSACWTPGNSVATSNHPGGTAIDLNWNSHPFQRRGSLNAVQMATLAEMEAFYEGNVFWAGRWDDPADEMHSQVGYNTYDQNADAPYPKVLDFIARKIRPDGFSTFRRGAMPIAAGISGDALAEAWGRRPGVDYAGLAPGCNDAMLRCGATTVNTSAMFLAQLGHESGGGVYREEIASGEAYNGRVDLGNTEPGDGPRFKGRSYVQVTGRTHYRNLSIWAHERGYVPTPTFFIDNPAALASTEYVWLGAVWYFLTQRPGFMAAAERGDLETCTRMVNGGLNGLADRRTYWDRARAMGDRILPAATTPIDPLEELLMIEVESWSIYADPGEPKIPAVQMLQALDAHGPHEPYVENQARAGDLDAIRRVARTAAGKGKYGTAPGPVRQALGVLVEIQAAHPEWITAATPGKA